MAGAAHADTRSRTMTAFSDMEARPLAVYLTVDVEVWPVHGGGWPHSPLRSDQLCTREVDAYLFGETQGGQYGLPYQLKTLGAFGLKATFFVDPMFSFALGLDPLREIVNLIQGAGQRIELHLHPEWLTDPRCEGLPHFRGPYMADYDEETQRVLIETARQRLMSAGAESPQAFRAGSWGGNVATLRALRRAGIKLDASLNACYTASFADLSDRKRICAPTLIGDVVEVPITRFDDGMSKYGRPLSIVGVSYNEMRSVLEGLPSVGLQACAAVLHSNEFVKTENLWIGRSPTPRRLVVNRFHRLCRFLARNRRFESRFVADCSQSDDVDATRDGGLFRTGLIRTAARSVAQLVSRYY